MAKEVPQISAQNPFVFRSRVQERKHLASLPRVIKYSERVEAQRDRERHMTLAWHDGPMRQNTNFLPYYNIRFQELPYPIYTMAAVGHPGSPLQAGSWGGSRHFFEAILYLPPGARGYEEQDGRRWEWEGEGVLCVPTYCHHRHHVTTPAERGSFLVISRIFEFLGIADFEGQLDPNPEFLAAFGGKAPEWYGVRNPELETAMKNRRSLTSWERGEPRTIYERFMKLTIEENQQWLSAPRFIGADSVPWELTRQGRMKWLAHPWMAPALRTLDAYIQEIPPGGSSGQHRHINEEIHLILEGSGYDIQDGQRHDWEQDDLVCIPIMTTHQHFNADPKRPARFLAVQTRWHYYAGHGGIEQFQDAPGYQA